MRIHAAAVFALARIQDILLRNYFCFGFVPGGISKDPPKIPLKTGPGEVILFESYF